MEAPRRVVLPPLRAWLDQHGVRWRVVGPRAARGRPRGKAVLLRLRGDGRVVAVLPDGERVHLQRLGSALGGVAEVATPVELLEERAPDGLVVDACLVDRLTVLVGDAEVGVGDLLAAGARVVDLGRQEERAGPLWPE